MIHLDIENVISKTECPKTFDIENITRHTEANKDFSMETAKFCFPIPSQTGRQVTVNVFASGKIVCTGANTLSRARTCTEMILKKLRVPEPFVYTVEYIVMSGYVTDLDIIPSVNKLKETYGVDVRDLMRKINIKDGNTLITFHYTTNPIKVVARGPDEKTILSMVRNICRICA